MNIQLPTFASNFLGARSRRSGVVLTQPPEVPAAQPGGGQPRGAWQGVRGAPPAASPHAGLASSSPFVACGVIGRPVWTPRNYTDLARAGYCENVVVFRCVSLIAKSLSSVRWLLYEQASVEEDSTELLEHPLLTLMRSPAPQLAGSTFFEHLLSQFLLSGNLYLAAHSGADGVPRQLELLRSDRVHVLMDDNGQLAGFAYDDSGGQRTFPSAPDASGPGSRVLHMKTFNPLSDWYGMSPIEAAARAIDQHNAVGEHNLAILQNGGRPSGALLVHPGGAGQTLSNEQRESLRESLRHLYEGTENAGRIMILEGDCEWKEMGLSPKDLDFHRGKNLSAREIAQAFGVPPILVGLTEDATFSNYKEARLQFWEDTLLPIADGLVAELNRWLVPAFGRGLRLGYDVDQIPALSAKRERVWAQIQAVEFLTINEKRSALGYSPLEGGDCLPISWGKRDCENDAGKSVIPHSPIVRQVQPRYTAEQAGAPG